MLSKISLSYLFTSLGYWIALFFIPLIVMEISQSAWLVSITYALDILPYIIFTPVVGVIGDKFNKKKIILFGEFVCVVASIFLFLMPFQDKYIPLMIILGFIISSFSAIHHPIFQSILPELYEKAQLPLVNANIASINSFTGIIAPAVLAILFGFMTSKQIALIIPICYLFSFGIFMLISHNPIIIKDNKIQIIKDNLEAVSFLKTHKNLTDYSYLFFFVNFGLRTVLAALIWIYMMRYGLTQSDIAYHFIIIGLMSILGEKVAGKYIVNQYPTRKVIYYSSLIMSAMIMLLLLYDNEYYLTFIWGGVSFLSMFIVVNYFTYRQSCVPQVLLS